MLSSSTAWCRAVIPAMLILFTSMSTLTLLNMLTTVSGSESLTHSSKITSSGNLTLLWPGFCLAKKLALLDIFCMCKSHCDICLWQLSNIIKTVCDKLCCSYQCIIVWWQHRSMAEIVVTECVCEYLCSQLRTDITQFPLHIKHPKLGCN